MKRFLKRWLKLSPSEISNMVYVTANFFDNIDILYIVEKVLKRKMLFNGNIFETITISKNSYKYTNKYSSYLYSNKCTYTLLYEYH